MAWRDEAPIRDLVGDGRHEAHAHPDAAGIVAHSSVAQFDVIERRAAPG